MSSSYFALEPYEKNGINQSGNKGRPILIDEVRGITNNDQNYNIVHKTKSSENQMIYVFAYSTYPVPINVYIRVGDNTYEHSVMTVNLGSAGSPPVLVMSGFVIQQEVANIELNIQDLSLRYGDSSNNPYKVFAYGYYINV